MYGREIMNANTPQMLASRASRDGVGQCMTDRLNIVIHKTWCHSAVADGAGGAAAADGADGAVNAVDGTGPQAGTQRAAVKQRWSREIHRS